MTQVSGTVTKALSLLDEFLDGSHELSLSQLAARTGIHKTTILRLCASLAEVGFLQREPGMAYRIGPKIWQLAQLYRRNFHVEDLIRPLLRGIRDETGESVSFYVVHGDERVCLFRENSHSVIRHHKEEGARLPLDSGVVGRVLMAFTDAKGARFEKIRKDGFLIAQGREPHTTSVAAPVIDGLGHLHGALVVSGPSFRFGSDASTKALRLLQDATAEIAGSLPHSIAAESANRVKPVRAAANRPSPHHVRAAAGRAARQTLPPRAGGTRPQSD